MIALEKTSALRRSQPSFLQLTFWGTKVCRRCGDEKPDTAFPPTKAKDSLSSWCRACATEATRIWRLKNPQQKDRDKVHHRQWYAERREERIEANRRWREDNPEKATALSRASNRRRRLDRDQAAVDYGYLVLSDPCSYCGAPSVNVDHIDPSAHGGSNEWTNLTGACESCNFHKHTTPLLHFLLVRERQSCL